MKVFVILAFFFLAAFTDGNDNELKCDEGFVSVEVKYGFRMCVECKDTITSGGCNGRPKLDMCGVYAAAGHCQGESFSKNIRKRCPVSCGLCGGAE